MELVTHKTLHFPHPREQVWSAMGEVGSYPKWWPWLKSFDADALRTGAVWRCSVSPPLPYTVSFAIEFIEVVECERVQASVSGDISGTAHLVLSDAGKGCDVVVRSDLEPRSTFLRVLAATVPPVARFGHDWILATGAKQFESRALTSDVPDTTT
jgi:uncharacterized protein YndB with AHSA1/START domain